jgi:hypothetical protein
MRMFEIPFEEVICLCRETILIVIVQLAFKGASGKRLSVI